MSASSPLLVRAERCRRDLRIFVQEFWDVVEPRPLVWNWHMDRICVALMDVSRGKTQNLAICVPPGSSKSLLVSVLWPAWEWLPGNWMAARNLFASKSKNVALRDSLRCRDVLKSDKYEGFKHLLAQEHGVPEWTFSGDQDQKILFKNSELGFRQLTTVNAKATGLRGDRLVVDDPYDVDEVIKGSSDRINERMQETWDWWNLKMASRLNDQANGSRVIIMQRLHQHDLIGKIQAHDPHKWKFLVFPMEYDPDLAVPEDPRTTPGELLFPAMFPQDFVEDKKGTEDGRGQYSAQYQQRPIPPEGGMFKEVWFNTRYSWRPGHYKDNPALPRFRRTLLSIDCANKAKELSDYTVILLLGEDEHGYLYLLDVWRDKVNFPGLLSNSARLIATWHPTMTLIEDAGNGQALIPMLRQTVRASIVGIIPTDSKDIRASNTTHFWHANRVVLPSETAPFIQVFLNEHRAFMPPGSSKDDQVDAMSQALNWIQDNQQTFVHRVAVGGVVVELSGSTGEAQAYHPGVDTRQRRELHTVHSLGGQAQSAPAVDQGAVMWRNIQQMTGGLEAFDPAKYRPISDLVGK